MKKLPKSITVFGRKIPIINITGKEIMDLYQEFTQPPQGLWDPGKRIIVINSDFELQDQRYTLFHEISHSVFTYVGLDLIVPPEIVEIIVQSQATLIEDVLDQAQLLK